MGDSLFDDPVGKAKRANGKALQTSAIARVEARYIERFEAKFGFTPKIAYGKERKLLQGLIAPWGESDVLALVDEFFATTDPKIVRSDYTLTAFAYHAQHLKLHGHRTDDRTADNIDAATRAMGKRR